MTNVLFTGNGNPDYDAVIEEDTREDIRSMLASSAEANEEHLVTDVQLAALLARPRELGQLDISTNLVIDILMRMMFQQGDVSVQNFANTTRLDAQVLDDILSALQNEHLIEVAGTGSLGRMSYFYALTDSGRERAEEALNRSQYVGPAPIPVERYIEAIQLQTSTALDLTREDFAHALGHLILPEDFDLQIGPAVNEGSSLFLYGPPGNGKTTIAEAIADLIGGTSPIWLPYALTIGGHIINIYDDLVHKAIPFDRRVLNGRYGVDERWGLFHRPVVIAGGELTMDALELRFDPVARFYEAPLQMKANGGMFLIDDFGRQTMRPIELLNRWIVPLETGIDFLRLRTGQTMQIPFRQLIVFSTNLNPLDLADEAFLRRIQMKILVDGPDERMYYQILKMFSDHYGLEVNKETFVHLIETHYRDAGRVMQAVHPRDLLKILVAMSNFERVKPELTPARLDAAAKAYFVDESETTWQQGGL